MLQLNWVKSEQNGCHFGRWLFQMFMNENVLFFLEISLKIVLKSPIENMSTLVLVISQCWWLKCNSERTTEPKVWTKMQTFHFKEFISIFCLPWGSHICSGLLSGVLYAMKTLILIDHHNRPISQIPQCTWSISHNAPIRTEMCTFLFWMVHCGIWERCTVGFVN